MSISFGRMYQRDAVDARVERYIPEGKSNVGIRESSQIRRVQMPLPYQFFSDENVATLLTQVRKVSPTADLASLECVMGRNYLKYGDKQELGVSDKSLIAQLTKTMNTAVLQEFIYEARYPQDQQQWYGRWAMNPQGLAPVDVRGVNDSTRDRTRFSTLSTPLPLF